MSEKVVAKAKICATALCRRARRDPDVVVREILGCARYVEVSRVIHLVAREECDIASAVNLACHRRARDGTMPPAGADGGTP